MAHNKIVLVPTGEVLIDLTQDDVTEADVVKGKTFHKADGTIAEGVYEPTVIEPETEAVTVALSMADGDQVIEASEDKFLSKVTLTKPATMLPENIKEGVEIGGVVGTHVGGTVPEGEIEITENGTHDVSQYATAKVQVGEAGESVNGYDIATMQKFITSRRDYGQLTYLYAYQTNTQTMTRLTDKDIEWLSKVDVGNAQYTNYMFYRCESAYWENIPLFDMSNIVDMTSMFEGASNSSNRGAFITIPAFDTSKVTKMTTAFRYRKLRNFPTLRYDSCTNMSDMFYEATFITTGDRVVPFLNLPKVTNLYHTFMYSNIVECEGINAPNCTNMASIFGNCTSLVNVGDLTVGDLANNSTSVFYSCSKLVSVGRIECSCRNFTQWFGNCAALETVEFLDCRNGDVSSPYGSMFNNCKAIKHIGLRNITKNITVGSGTSYGHLLTVGSLIGLCYELLDKGTSYRLTVGTANLAKLANVYVKTIDITDEMTAADDLVSEKLPFEAYVVDPDNTADITSHVTTTRVSSVDELPEGAVLMSDYVVLKNWQLA